MESILVSVKNLLGITNEDVSFDSILIMHINSVLSVLHQLGVGPENGFSIADEFSKWTDILPVDDSKFELVKSYVYLKVKLLCDPPTISAVAESNKRLCDELEWRITVAADSAK